MNKHALSRKKRVKEALEVSIAPLKLKPKSQSRAIQAILNVFDDVVLRKEFFTGRKINDTVEVVICHRSRMDWLNRTSLVQDRVSICKTVVHWEDVAFDWEIFILGPGSGGGY